MDDSGLESVYGGGLVCDYFGERGVWVGVAEGPLHQRGAVNEGGSSVMCGGVIGVEIRSICSFDIKIQYVMETERSGEMQVHKPATINSYSPSATQLGQASSLLGIVLSLKEK